MRYLIIVNSEPFYTNYIEAFDPIEGNIVIIDLELNLYIKKGIDWEEIDEDHL